MTTSKDKQKLNIAVLFGGQSGEHEVSLTSAKNVMDAIDREKYNVVPIGISKNGLWLQGETVWQQLNDATDLPPRLAADASQVITHFLDESLLKTDPDLTGIDVVFPMLHGPMGEDGTVQGFLELANLPYVGCGVVASAVAMDKAIAKDVFRANGLSQLPYRTILRRRWQQTPDLVVAQLENDLHYPMFVKPANMGSSVGVSKAIDRDGLQNALNEAARYDRKLVIEQGIDAREIEVSVLGNDQPIASVPGEVVPNRDYYSYAAKYLDDSSELLIPAPLSPAESDAIRTMAVVAFQVIDGSGLARVDFLLDKADGKIYLNEVNTMPGFTSISMYPKLWAASGITYTELIDRFIELALARHADKTENNRLFDVSQAS